MSETRSNSSRSSEDRNILDAFFGEPRKPRKKPPVKRTRTGKVVYNRRPHYFTTNDAKRILTRIFDFDGPYQTWYGIFIAEWLEIELYMIGAMIRRTANPIAGLFFEWLLGVISQAVNGLTPPPPNRTDEEGGTNAS